MSTTLDQILAYETARNASVSTTTAGYTGFFENSNSTNVANMTSLNLDQFDRLRCELEKKGIDAFGSQLIAKEFLNLVKQGTFTFQQILALVNKIGVGQQGLRFTQLYLNALNSQRGTTSRLDLIGDEPIPENVNRAIIF
jgi:hypothetical protein